MTIAANGACEVTDGISYDPEREVLTIDGINYARSLFSGLGLGPIGKAFRIIARDDGVVTLQTIEQEQKSQ